MRKLFFALLVVISYHSAFAAWENVIPAIQSVTPTGTEGPHRLSDTLIVCYLSDSLEWAADEFAERLEQAGILGIPKRINTLSGLVVTHLELPDADQILLAANPRFLDSLRLLLDEDTPPSFPNSLPGDESYCIWVKNEEVDLEDPGLVKFVGAILSKSLRGTLYGISSFEQALQGSPIPEDPRHFIPSAVVVDFPTFPRRIIGEPFDMDTSVVWNTPETHAEAILEGARDLLLENKGNGFIQFGKEDGASIVFEQLATGDTLSDHVDTWQDLSMEWYQGIGKWGGATDAQKKRSKASAYIYKEVHFGGIDSLTPFGVRIIPDATEYPQENFDFENTSHLVEWDTTAGWATPSEGLNEFARSPVMVDSGSKSRLYRFMQYQDTVGLPMRQLVLEFRVRLSQGDSAEVWIESLMPPDSNGFALTDEDNYQEGDFKIFDAKHHSKKLRFRHTVSSTSWDTLSVVFYSFGLKYDYLTFWFMNVGDASARVDFDGIRLYESDNYFLHVVETDGRLDSDFATFILDSMGPSGWTEVGAINAHELRLRELQSANCDAGTVWWHPRLRLRESLIDDFGLTLADLANSPNFRGRFYYHAACPSALLFSVSAFGTKGSVLLRCSLGV